MAGAPGSREDQLMEQSPPPAAGWPQMKHGEEAERERQEREQNATECWPPAQPTNVENKAPAAHVSEVPPVDNAYWPKAVESVQQDKRPAVNGTDTTPADPKFWSPFIETAPGYAPARNGIDIPEHREIPPTPSEIGAKAGEGFLQRQQRERDAALRRKRR